MKTATLLISLLLAAPLIGACDDDSGAAPAASDSKEKKEADAISIRVAPIERAGISSIYTSSTTLRAKQRATVVAKTEGIVNTLSVEEGDQVKDRQSLALLDSREQSIGYERAKLTAQARQREYQRQKELHSRSLTSDMELEQARSQSEDAAQAKALAKLNLDRTTIRAPFAGTILKRHVDRGQALSNGSAVYDLADLTTLYADVNIPERHVTTLKTGQVVLLTADATENQVQGTIERLAPEVDATTGTVRVTITVPGESSLRPGAFVRAGITTDTHENAAVIPRGALVAEGRRWYIFVLNEEDQTVKRLEVKLGYEEGDRVELLGSIDEKGALQTLGSGLKVASVGAPALSDGVPVRVHGPSGEEATGGTP